MSAPIAGAFGPLSSVIDLKGRTCTVQGTPPQFVREGDPPSKVKAASSKALHCQSGRRKLLSCTGQRKLDGAGESMAARTDLQSAYPLCCATQCD